MSDQKVYIFTCTPEFGELIESLSKNVEGGTEALFQKSLILMGVALKTKKNGHKIAILDENGKQLDTIEVG